MKCVICNGSLDQSIVGKPLCICLEPRLADGTAAGKPYTKTQTISKITITLASDTRPNHDK